MANSRDRHPASVEFLESYKRGTYTDSRHRPVVTCHVRTHNIKGQEVSKLSLTQQFYCDCSCMCASKVDLMTVCNLR